MLVVLIGSAAGLAYVYLGYSLLLRAMACCFGRRPLNSDPPRLSVTVLITVHNEQERIAARIENVLACDFDSGQLKIVVASDGSTDQTEEIARNYADRGVGVFRPNQRVGKSGTQNGALALISTDIVVFTDADTRFSPSFLTEIIRPFSEAQVGCVGGQLFFSNDDLIGDIAFAQGRYWAQELAVRRAESDLGMLAVVSGACMAIRRNLVKPLPAAIGEDCVVPLDVCRQNFQVRHAPLAIAFDRGARTATEEFQSRVRMTLRNWQGTWLYADLLNPLRHPRIALGLWSHKILRWLSPFMLIGFWLASVALVFSRSPSRLLGLPGVVMLLACAFASLLPPCRRLPGLRSLWPFLVANSGFALGVARGIAGQQIITYR